MNRLFKTAKTLIAAAILTSSLSVSEVKAQSPSHASATNSHSVLHRTRKVNGLDIFYREAGPTTAPTVYCCTLSNQLADVPNLIPQLSDRYHVIAPDYPGYGHSSMPKHTEFEYSFDNLANVIDDLLEDLQVDSYVLYVQDYGAPIGYRLATAHPERVRGFIVRTVTHTKKVSTTIFGSQ